MNDAVFDNGGFAGGESAGGATVHNLKDGAPGEDQPSSLTVSAGQLRAIIERVENLEAEKKEVADQKKEEIGEAKSKAYDVETLSKKVAIRKKKQEERSEEEAMLDLYMSALGMLEA